MMDSQQKNNFDNKLFGFAINAVFTNDATKLSDCLDKISSQDLLIPLLRTAMIQPHKKTLWYQQLLMKWDELGNPGLKPNALQKQIHIISDHTCEPIEVFLRTKLATVGINSKVTFSDFDSVESECLNQDSNAFSEEVDYAALLLSTHWLEKFFPLSGLSERGNIQNAINTLDAILNSLASGGKQVIVCEFLPPSINPPCAKTSLDNQVGVLAGIAEINAFLRSRATALLSVIDLPSAIFYVNGAQALSELHFVRAKMPYSQTGFAALGKAVGSCIASLSGNTTRAVVFDLDNTIWGGVLGEVGERGIVTGRHSPEELGYYRLQEYLNGLASCGIILGVASKNNPESISVFEDNPDLAFTPKSISAYQIHWEPKSSSMSELSMEFGFGTEYFLFIDDNIFELAEVLLVHPYIDVLLSSEDPVETLCLLGSYSLFQGEHLTTADLLRNEHFSSLKASENTREKFHSYEDYLESLGIKLRVEHLNEENQDRVVQLIQKSNQFNLTTQRYNLNELEELVQSGADVGVVSYEDNFGYQGIISVVILKHEKTHTLIDTWLMSCRVLNRTVEHAVCNWMISHAITKLSGKFIPTDKNGIVKDLFQNLGFAKSNIDEGDSSTTWEFLSEKMKPLTTFAAVEDNVISGLNPAIVGEQ